MREQKPRMGWQEYKDLAPDAYEALLALSKAVSNSGIEPDLIELIKLRASQINGCAFCTQYHLNAARKLEISQAKLDLLVVWREAGIFSAREQAAFAWTEELTRLPLRILDVGTGTGAIALALAARLPTGSITATDISPPTLAVAQDNADRLGLAHRIVFILSDLLDELAPQLNQGHPFNIIVSNPPYVPSTDAPLLQPEVVHHEPHTALFAGPTGLDIYRRLIPQARSALSPAGLLALEFGFGQREPLTELLKGWRNIRFIDDYAGIPRVALAIRP